jgi:hypothetical protein
MYMDVKMEVEWGGNLILKDSFLGLLFNDSVSIKTI